MKKLGILTYHEINNFGAQLQAASLRKFCIDCGYECDIINYQPPRSRARIAAHIIRPALKLKTKEYFRNLEARNTFRKSAIELGCINTKALYTTSGVQKISKNYDALICGSDEIWNFGNYLGHQPPFILDFPFDGKKISYAASMGSYNLPTAEKSNFEAALRQFSTILVRDNHTAEAVRGLSLHPKLVLDPTYLVELTEKIVDKENQLILSGEMTEDQLETAKKIAQALNLKIISPGYLYKGLENSYFSATALEWVQHINRSKYHITSLFHGSIFSIKSSTPFVAFMNESKRNKLGFMLEQLKMKERAVEVNNTQQEILSLLTKPFSAQQETIVQDLAKESRNKLTAALAS
ncbi:Polysaccharide pyruvyl transferase [Halopseudomonas sabulinigri]|uniref:Polysaccharide pyruvyl transferase n=1 Tax=Halopseudomonas sabulinigri TaxID=472181 RepID=A0A1H1L8G4_9GAMM|nr:polysaccharide pyruvyl transferase family protein [Halopseudomonas sabulinigri]SDR70798.1 Polysaccharide pyruvyl transferase [Halopseudomonas sabulinigri]